MEDLIMNVMDEATCDLVRSCGVLSFADENIEVYRLVDGTLCFLPPTVHNTDEAAVHVAVVEAGFATEELRSCIKDLYECLYVRMLQEPASCSWFTDKEWEACKSAKHLLGLDP
jgi:hypothetical protein